MHARCKETEETKGTEETKCKGTEETRAREPCVILSLYTLHTRKHTHKRERERETTRCRGEEKRPCVIILT